MSPSQQKGAAPVLQEETETRELAPREWTLTRGQPFTMELGEEITATVTPEPLGVRIREAAASLPTGSGASFVADEIERFAAGVRQPLDPDDWQDIVRELDDLAARVRAASSTGDGERGLTPHEARCVLIALVFGDPVHNGRPDPPLESAKQKLRAIKDAAASSPSTGDSGRGLRETLNPMDRASAEELAEHEAKLQSVHDARVAAASSSEEGERCANCDLEEMARSCRHELEGEALATMERLGFEIVRHTEDGETCFSCSLGRMLDRLTAAPPSSGETGGLTQDEAIRVLMALIFGDPANAGPRAGGPRPDPVLESAKRKLDAMRRAAAPPAGETGRATFFVDELRHWIGTIRDDYEEDEPGVLDRILAFLDERAAAPGAGETGDGRELREWTISKIDGYGTFVLDGPDTSPPKDCGLAGEEWLRAAQVRVREIPSEEEA